MYGATWIAALWYTVRARRNRVKRFPIWLFLLLLPIAIDGASHMFSDFNGGLFEGFRYTNTWLVQLTGNVLPSSFYAGDALGSFNSWMRLVSGLTFGLAIGGFVLPIFDEGMKDYAALLRRKLETFAERQKSGQVQSV